jgi:hypothetical protein
MCAGFSRDFHYDLPQTIVDSVSFVFESMVFLELSDTLASRLIKVNLLFVLSKILSVEHLESFLK